MLRPSRRFSQGATDGTGGDGHADAGPGGPLDLGYGGAAAHHHAPPAAASPYGLSYGTAAAPPAAAPHYGVAAASPYGGAAHGAAGPYGAVAHSGGAASGSGGYGYGGAGMGGGLGGGYGNNNVYKDKPARRQPHRGGGGGLDSALALARRPAAWAALVAVLLLYKTVSYRSQVNRLLADMNVRSLPQAWEAVQALQTGKLESERDHAKARSQERQSTQKFIDLDRAHKTLQRERDDLKKRLKAAEARAMASVNGLAATSAATQQQQQGPSEKEQAYKELVQSLQASVQRESRRAVLEKFGAPPYRVDLTVRLPSDLQKPQTFRIEMAPVESMPHAVHLFLEQVAHGLWSGNAFFYINGPHVIQCGPQASLKEGEVRSTPQVERQRALAPFKELQLDALAFPEYSDQFPHLPWTLGFTGRPGGPDWYINKRNNSMEHGPGGTGSVHALSSDYGDPCFAKVVDGYDVVQRMFAEPTIHSQGSSAQFYFQEPIQLLRAEIVGWNPQLVAEAAALAANATVQHATDDRRDVNATIQLATSSIASGAAPNLSETAASIAAKLAEVGELQKKLEGMASGPWEAQQTDANRERQDLTQEADASSSGASADSVMKIAEDLSKQQGASLFDGVQRPEVKTEPAGANNFVYEGGNIDPLYADQPKEGEVTAATPSDSAPGTASDSAGSDRRRKKELMMARG